MRHFYLVILTCCLYSCESKPPPNPFESLLGHWHLHYQSIHSGDTLKREYPVDLYFLANNQRRHTWPYRKGISTGMIDLTKMKIGFLENPFDNYNWYKWTYLNDSTVYLFLNEPATTKTQMVLRRRTNGYDHQRTDYFRIYPYPLQFPKTNRKPKTPPEIDLISSLYLKHTSNDSLVIQISNRKFNRLDGRILSFFDEEHLSGFYPPKQDLAVKIIFTDETTPVSSLQVISKHYHAKGRDSLFFAVEAPETSDTFRVYYQPVAVSTLLESEGILGDLIK